MSDAVYLHYTQEELDRNFDQRSWAKNSEEVIARYPRRSEATRKTLRHRLDVRYGAGMDEVLDIFLADKSPAPVQIFVHGGAWARGSKSDYSFVADTFVPAGIHTVVLNFSKLPQARLPDVVAQVRRACEWVYRNAASFGGDPARIHACAHSSGAHLTAMALVEDWPARGLPQDFIKGATLLSGPYDLEPVVLSARSAYVVLSAEEVSALSPIRHVARIGCPVIAAHGENDTDEFRRQSTAFIAALERAGKPLKTLRLAGANHFEAMEQYGDPSSPLGAAVLAQVRGR
jgi:arylformamidase